MRRQVEMESMGFICELYLESNDFGRSWVTEGNTEIDKATPFHVRRKCRLEFKPV